MFLISVKKEEVQKLKTDGVAVRINGKLQILKRDGDYLIYAENRCKILSATNEGHRLAFVCASHGDEHEPHVIVGAEGGVMEFNRD